MATVVETTMDYHLDPSRGGGRENEFNIHTHAFQACKWKPSTTSLDWDEVQNIVRPEAEEFVKTITNATRVHCFSHLIRQNTVEDNIEALKKLEADKGRENISDKEGFGKIVPARYAHVDQSGKGARTLLGHNLPDEAEKLTNTRWGTVNLWRPIQRIRRDPLCFCDGRSISEEDLVPVNATPPPKGTSSFYDSVSKGDGFETLEVRANPKHKWYYLSDMQPDEALVFKCSDSKNPSESRCCHASFRLPDTANEAARESMEMRFFVFYENEPIEGF
ncbi:hypothetical protein ONZ43_g5388 [Nemania bipapillata]|uniref:Uncharacterized protein n=1 Tax=Nemania bipapillata TaxID=110536 RepID=A0ACC2IBE3_9PEZI|nr:hypothetical protein ONZ43_g5388 [Nemania bipapillata]